VGPHPPTPTPQSPIPNPHNKNIKILKNYNVLFLL